MALLRRFGQLATLSKTALGQAMVHFRNSSVEKRLKEKADWPDYVRELVGAHHTTQPLKELVTFAIAQKTPLTLWRRKDHMMVQVFMVKALETGNMTDLNSALFLCHCHPSLPVPAFEVYSELVRTAPVGSPENQTLWRRTLADMLYYSYPSCMSEVLNDLFFANYGPISETLTAFMRLSVEVDDSFIDSDDEIDVEEDLEDQDPIRQQQDDFIVRYLDQAKTETFTRQDYEQARDFVLHEVDVNLRQFPRNSMCLLLNIARLHRDYEFICRVYMDYEKFSVDMRPDLLVNCVMDFLLHGKFAGSRWEAVKQVLREHLGRPIAEEDEELVNLSQEPLLCQFDSTNDCMITALIEAGLHQRAALYMFDCSRCALPYDPKLEIILAQHFVEKEDLCHLMAVRDCSGDMLNSRKLSDWTEILRSKLQKKGEVHEDQFTDKYYTATEPLLRPYLEGLDNSVADSAEKDYAYSEVLARICTQLTPHRLDVDEADHSERLYESDPEDGDEALAGQIADEAQVNAPEALSQAEEAEVEPVEPKEDKK